MRWLKRLFHRCRNFDYIDGTIQCRGCDFILIPSENKYKTGYIWRIPYKFTEDQIYKIIALIHANSPKGHIHIQLEEKL